MLILLLRKKKSLAFSEEFDARPEEELHTFIVDVAEVSNRLFSRSPGAGEVEFRNHLVRPILTGRFVSHFAICCADK